MSSIRQYHRTRVSEALQVRSMTLKEIAQELGVNYYTVRTTVRDLEEAAVVSAVGSKGRALVYGLKDIEGYLGNKIPSLVDTVKEQQIKALGLAYMIPTIHQSKATRASLQLPRHIAKLLTYAPRATKNPDINTLLDVKRTELQHDLMYLKNLVSLFEQVLDEPRFWNPNTLEIMAQDDEYNFEELEELLNDNQLPERL